MHGASGAEQIVDDCIIEVLRHTEDPRIWKVVMTLAFGTGDTPRRYVGKLQMVGEFSVAEAVTGETAENLVNVNGPAILYSSAREILFGLTARSINGPWMLPSVTFINRKKKAVPQGEGAPSPEPPQKAVAL
ncbi:MAG: hypothetical protein ACK4UN_02605 [Limisphaerales bacterium]